MSTDLDLSQIMLEYLQKYFLPITGTIISSIFGTWIWKFRPRRTLMETKIEYVDDSLSMRVEQKEFSFTWGRVPFWRKVTIYEIPLLAHIEITLVPPDLVEIPLNHEYYEIKSQKNMKKIILKNKEFFENQQVNKVVVVIKQPASILYRDKIKNEIYNNLIEIENGNTFEIKNYIMPLNDNVKLERLTGSYNEVSHIRIEITIPRLPSVFNEQINSIGSTGITPFLIVKSIPPKRGDVVGKTLVPLN